MYGDGFFVNNNFAPMEHYARSVALYRERFAAHGHGRPEDGIVGAGGGDWVRPNSQDALNEYRPYFGAHPIHARSGLSLEEEVAQTGLTVGSPAQVIEKVLTFPAHFGQLRTDDVRSRRRRGPGGQLVIGSCGQKPGQRPGFTSDAG